VHSSEWRFGTDGDVALALPGGRRLAVQGAVDRVDETPDGFVVTDHKTGRADGYRPITDADPTGGGRFLQLAAYAAATLARAGHDDAVVQAEYSFFRRGDYRRITATFTPEVWSSVGEVVGEVVDGIESGLFPHLPEPPGFSPFVPCRYCEPDGLGRTERWAQWQRKRHDRRLARWFGDPPADTDSDTDTGRTTTAGAP
jgi:ATP-dependent helicase/nuclease subunit B